MQRAINTTRCCVFGLVWGYGLASIWLISEVIKQQVTHTADAPRSIPYCLLIWAIGGLLLTGFGALVALPPVIVLGIFDVRVSTNRRKLVVCSVLSMAILVWGRSGDLQEQCVGA